MAAPPPPAPPDREGPHAVVVAIGALTAGAVTTVVVFFVGRFLLGVLSAHWPWIVAVVVAVSVLALVAAVLLAAERHQARLREERLRELAHLERVDVMTGLQFEELTADLLCRDGFRAVEVIGRAGDRGVDVTALTDGGAKIAIQCKRQKKPVGADRVRNLIGAINSSYRDHIGVLVTNNTFTRQARAEAEGHLVLIGRDELARWMDDTPLTL
ncbi:restriction endonuclease [Spirillospora sp. NPDC029432]|uniref:restriction endonuclease n=1 Tax=Spirillospora sp. NPDC029432 TaxID=3154599 RepID=UPI00345283D8